MMRRSRLLAPMVAVLLQSLAIVLFVLLPSPAELYRALGLTHLEAVWLLHGFFLIAAISFIVLELWLPKPADRASGVLPLEYFATRGRS